MTSISSTHTITDFLDTLYNSSTSPDFHLQTNHDLAHRPFVTLTYAQSLDGKIAGVDGQQLRLSGNQSMKMTHMLAGTTSIPLISSIQKLNGPLSSLQLMLTFISAFFPLWLGWECAMMVSLSGSVRCSTMILSWQVRVWWRESLGWFTYPTSLCSHFLFLYLSPPILHLSWTKEQTTNLIFLMLWWGVNQLTQTQLGIFPSPFHLRVSLNLSSSIPNYERQQSVNWLKTIVVAPVNSHGWSALVAWCPFMIASDWKKLALESFLWPMAWTLVRTSLLLHSSTTKTKTTACLSSLSFPSTSWLALTYPHIIRGSNGIS